MQQSCNNWSLVRGQLTHNQPTQYVSSLLRNLADEKANEQIILHPPPANEDMCLKLPD